MARIYYKLINRGLKVLDDVPEKWYDEVKELLEEDKE